MASKDRKVPHVPWKYDDRSFEAILSEENERMCGIPDSPTRQCQRTEWDEDENIQEGPREECTCLEDYTNGEFNRRCA
ncbi:hypothetical protein M413DRAFT_448573 [Hebeloma cylindrosporum]|uniref:Uncharacterized protein n=1 Tax=Hebeloma cylindrosporum TaxID=76867 RepID=A0A0C2XHC5_HEBCY|nr:hypothetical protein M413DRAFT_448573 [Hebeloma cylindrosporum h7]